MKRLLTFLIVAACTGVAQADPVTFTQSQLLDLGNLGWGPGVLNGSPTDNGLGGVDYDVTLGTSDYGKLALGKEPPGDEPVDWSGKTIFYLKVELLSASGATQQIEVNPHIAPAWGWAEDKDGVALGVGDSYTMVWDLTSDSEVVLSDLDEVRRYGFQVFTAGDVENPEAMDAVIRVTPTLVPEPASLILLGLGGVAMIRRRR